MKKLHTRISFGLSLELFLKGIHGSASLYAYNISMSFRILLLRIAIPLIVISLPKSPQTAKTGLQLRVLMKRAESITCHQFLSVPPLVTSPFEIPTG